MNQKIDSKSGTKVPKKSPKFVGQISGCFGNEYVLVSVKGGDFD